jgi:phytoene desaturase
MNKKVIVIGSGFAGLASAALLARDGFDVTILEKNDQPGGRARTWAKDGFLFDMGPSWYWMPDVFEDFFALFGKKVSDYYQLERLDPAYRIYFGQDETMDIPANMQELEALFESYEPGSSAGLRKFMEQAAYKYKVGMSDYVFRPSHNIFEFFDLRLIRESFRIQMFKSLSKHVRQYFSHPKLLKLLEFPVLFLGATPEDTPALYSMMNYADLGLGTWYPKGGMNQIVQGMVAVAKEQGVKFQLNTEVTRIEVIGKDARKLHTSQGEYEADILVANADYQHTDQRLLDAPYRHYTPKYWDKRTMSPSSLLFYLGVNKKIEGILHHNLFFDRDFQLHARKSIPIPNGPPIRFFTFPAPPRPTPVAPQREVRTSLSSFRSLPAWKTVRSSVSATTTLSWTDSKP